MRLKSVNDGGPCGFFIWCLHSFLCSMNSTRQLPVMETFYTVQGEGAYAGAPAFFIRLAGCDVGCVWCDVKESWDAEKHPLQSIESLTDAVSQSGTGICVITGGEPTLHDLSELTKRIRAKGIRTHLETSGTQPLTGEWDWITFSPKKFKAPLDEYYAKSHELKVIVNHASDISWAQNHADKMSAQTSFYMQPEWEKREVMQEHILDYIRRNTQWRISVQTHKYLGVD